MQKNIYPSFIYMLLSLIILGILYPFSLVSVGEYFFKSKVHGSLLYLENESISVGSKLIGQFWTDPKYFHGRPSAIGYNASTSGGSQFGPTNPNLILEIKKNQSMFINTKSVVPYDLLLASGSGLDPDISPESAFIQVSRIAYIRHLDENKIKQLIRLQVEKKILGIWGQDRINVLELNNKLDRLE